MKTKTAAKRGTLRRLDALATDGVERSAPDGPPSAFRIWKAGLNVTDHGPTVFSERSASLLMAEQATRGNRYSIDVDHLSLDKNAPIANHAAVGWHSLEVRDGELWATNVEWSNSVIAGLTKDPPEWKYFSPAYDVDPESGEVVSYLNTALTNNPATHRVTALAARGAKVEKMAKATKKMSWGDIKAALDGDDENKRAEAYAAIQAAFPDASDEDEKKDAEGSDEDEKKDAEEGDDTKKDAADEPEKADAEDEPSKKDSRDLAATTAALDARVRKLEAENAALRAKNEGEQKRSLIAARVMSAELAKTLASKPLAFVKDVCAGLPAKVVDSKSTESVQATRGAGHVDGDAAALPSDEKRELDERMGLVRREGFIRNEGVHQIFATLTPAEARKRLESKEGK